MADYVNTQLVPDTTRTLSSTYYVYEEIARKSLTGDTHPP